MEQTAPVNASADGHVASEHSAVESAKLQALYHFAYGLSHEINNPLANIATRAQTLLVDEKDSERRRKLATIVQQAFRAHEMIADLMLFARPPALKPEQVDLAKLVETVVAEVQPAAREQGTCVIASVKQAPLVITADSTQLAVALKALVQNALEAVRTGGIIEVCAERMHVSEAISTEYPVLSTPTSNDPTNRATILRSDPAPLSPVPCPLSPSAALPTRRFLVSVSDTGPGIPPEVRPHIFDPFFSGREAGRGLGLGLSKAWRIAELHGGTIEVESAAERGAKFSIHLPAG
jgi:signal transduction histidine kinase